MEHCSLSIYWKDLVRKWVCLKTDKPNPYFLVVYSCTIMFPLNSPYIPHDHTWERHLNPLRSWGEKPGAVWRKHVRWGAVHSWGDIAAWLRVDHLLSWPWRFSGAGAKSATSQARRLWPTVAKHPKSSEIILNHPKSEYFDSFPTPTRLIIGEHGGAMANMLLARNGTGVIELVGNPEAQVGLKGDFPPYKSLWYGALLTFRRFPDGETGLLTITRSSYLGCLQLQLTVIVVGWLETTNHFSTCFIRCARSQIRLDGTSPFPAKFFVPFIMNQGCWVQIASKWLKRLETCVVRLVITCRYINCTVVG